jgi:tRNA G37 N-methylase Trm5
MDNPDSTALFVVFHRHEGALVHAHLKAKGWLDAAVEPVELEDDFIGFPISVGDTDEDVLGQLSVSARLERHRVVPRSAVDPHQRMNEALQAWMTQHVVDESLGVPALPSKWERLGDLVLFPHEVLCTEAWQRLRQHNAARSLWEGVAAALKCISLGIQAPIASDTFRSSQVEMLLGSSNVRFLDHGIIYTFDAAKVMFSSGNVTERRRIGSINMEGETVVDAFAGVGYYTFPMLVGGRAAHVHACEINPASIQGLRAGAKANGLEEQLTIHEGDNADTLPRLRGLADRCHLGLLPSSALAWNDALLTLKPSGGRLHVHMNVEEERLTDWTLETLQQLQAIADEHALNVTVEAEHLEKVKWFAPRVRHVVLDVKVTPNHRADQPSPHP